MRRGMTAWLALALVACSGQAIETTTTAPPPSTTTTVVDTTTTTRLPDCPAPPYEFGSLPSTVQPNQVPAANLSLDEFTTAAGSSSTIWVGGDGDLAMALVRGALPPEQWPGERGEVDIDGARGVAGPFEDGTWVVAWYEEPGARCDQYTLVFYPPIEPSEVEATIESIDRTAG